MIVYGSLMSNVPTGTFAAIVPGVLIGLGEMALVYYFSRKRNYPRENQAIYGKRRPLLQCVHPSCGSHTGCHCSGHFLRLLLGHGGGVYCKYLVLHCVVLQTAEP